jgi:hypothetical protein
MHALNRRPLTLRANQIFKPKDHLRKIPVDNFEQLATGCPIRKSMNINSEHCARRAASTNGESRCSSVPCAQKLDIFARPCGTPFRNSQLRPLLGNDLRPPLPKSPNQNPLNPEVQTLLHPPTRNHPCKTVSRQPLTPDTRHLRCLRPPKYLS